MTKLSAIGQCHDCGARVYFRETAKGYVMYHCNAEIEDKACKARHTFGPRNSRDLLDQMEKAQKNERRNEETGTATSAETGTGDGTGNTAPDKQLRSAKSLLERIVFDD